MQMNWTTIHKNQNLTSTNWKKKKDLKKIKKKRRRKRWRRKENPKWSKVPSILDYKVQFCGRKVSRPSITTYRILQTKARKNRDGFPLAAVSSFSHVAIGFLAN